MNQSLIIIAGSTASGKSEAAEKIAEGKPSVIINADSQQIYKEFPILTAQPGQRYSPNYKLYGHVNAGDNYSVATWLKQASEEIKTAWSRGQQPILAGGTGMYISSLINGIAEVPEIDEEIRRFVRNLNLPVAYKKLQDLDPQICERINENDTQRIYRALEVIIQTGTSLLIFQNQENKKIFPDLIYSGYIISPPKEILEDRILNRFQAMLEQGVIEEVKSNQNADVRIIGLNEIKEYLVGTISAQELSEKIIISTRQYAKRQRTWFRNQIKNLTIVSNPSEIAF